MKVSSELDVGLGLGESGTTMEVRDFHPGAHHFELLISSIPSQPDLSSSVCGRGRGVPSD